MAKNIDSFTDIVFKKLEGVRQEGQMDGQKKAPGDEKTANACKMKAYVPALEMMSDISCQTIDEVGDLQGLSFLSDRRAGSLNR